MATYLILNITFTIIVCLLFKIDLKRITKQLLATFVLLLLLTAIFDNVLILASIVDYDPSKLLGLYVYVAPIEDFMYSLLAVLLVPTLWHKIGKRDDS